MRQSYDDPHWCIEHEPSGIGDLGIGRRMSMLLEWFGRKRDAVIVFIVYFPVILAACTVLFRFPLTTQIVALFASWAIGVFGTLFFIISRILRFKREFLLARTRSLEEVRKLKWSEFEHFVAALMELDGWEVERRGGEYGDGGIDHILRRDGERWVVQCKHWSMDLVPVHPLRELYGIMARDGYDGAMFFVSGNFSPLADEEFGSRSNVKLFNGARIVGMIDRLRDRLPEPGDEGEGGLLARTTALVGKVATPREPGTIRVPECPHCKTTMFLKIKDDNRFWACRNWPDRCKQGKTRTLSPEDRAILHLEYGQ